MQKKSANFTDKKIAITAIALAFFMVFGITSSSLAQVTTEEGTQEVGTTETRELPPKPELTRAQAEQKAMEVKANIEKRKEDQELIKETRKAELENKREEKKTEMEAKREEIKTGIENKREEKKTEMEAKKEARIGQTEERKAEMSALREEKKVQFEARKAELETKREDRKAEMEAKREELKAKMEERKVEREAKNEERKAQLDEKAKERIGKALEKMTKRFDAAIERLVELGTRIDSRIAKLNDEGIDTTSASSKLVAARAKIAEAESLLSNVSVSSIEITEGETPKEAFANAKNSYETVKDSVKEAHRLMVDSISDLKSSLENRQSETSEISAE